MRAQIKRLEKGDRGVFGILLLNSQVFCPTLERPWVYNERDISCIPEQIYFCRRVMSPKFGETFEVQNVQQRDNILFHVGNVIEDSLGCILLGSSFGMLGEDRGIIDSREAFKSFMKKLEGIEIFPLLISNIT